MTTAVKRAGPLVLVLLASGCGGGGSTTERAATATQPSVVKPLVVHFASGTAQLSRSSNTRTAVTLSLTKTPKDVTAELDKGFCRGTLRLTKPLGKVTARRQSWSIVAPLNELVSAPLAVVIRSVNDRVAACGQVPAQGR